MRTKINIKRGTKTSEGKENTDIAKKQIERGQERTELKQKKN